MNVGVLLLAAGCSARYGADKRSVVLADGRSMLTATVASVLDSGLPLRVCLGPGDDTLASQLGATSVESLLCPRSAQGMGATLADGVRQLPKAWAGVLIALGDMPFVSGGTYASLAQALAPTGICVPLWQGRRGNPVGFGAQYFPQLCALEGDRGARALLSEHSQAVTELAVADPGIHLDVDVPSDLARPAIF